MPLKTARSAFAIALVCLAGPRDAGATPFSDPALFFAAVSGLPGSSSTLDFDSLPVATGIPSGGSIGGITFTSDIGLEMIVSSGFSTTSGSNYLGLADGGDEVFLALDEWEMAFASPLQAFGMFIVSSDPLLEDDIRLVTSAGTAQNAGVEHLVLDDGGLAYFLGIVSDGSPFGSAQLRYGPGVTDIFFAYNVDDLTAVTAAAAPVPEPSTMLLTSTALAAMLARRRSRRKAFVKE